MKTIGDHKIIARIARSGLALAALCAIVLSSSVVGRAQTNATLPVASAATSAKAAADSQATQPAKPAERKPEGNHEGIKIHGHWTIEVRNPDGKLVSRTEFENSLTSTGQETLTSLLLGTIVPGGFFVRLADSANGSAGPCQPLSLGLSSTNCILIGSLISPPPAGFGETDYQCGGTGFANQITSAGPCFPLSITASSSANQGLTFSGTAVAGSTDSITNVFLAVVSCGALPPPPTTIATSPSLCAQGTAKGFNLTAATLPTAVTISAAGQLISVNVQLSFQ